MIIVVSSHSQIFASMITACIILIDSKQKQENFKVKVTSMVYKNRNKTINSLHDHFGQLVAIKKEIIARCKPFMGIVTLL